MQSNERKRAKIIPTLRILREELTQPKPERQNAMIEKIQELESRKAAIRLNRDYSEAGKQKLLSQIE